VIAFTGTYQGACHQSVTGFQQGNCGENCLMELSAYFRFVAALLFVLGIIGVFALLARRFLPGARNINRRGSKRRLSVVEVVPVDTKRRLVLLKRDDTEHLVMIGPNGDTVIERNIGMQFSELLGNQAVSDEPLPTANTDLATDAPQAPDDKDADQKDRNVPA
jgi:flagellar protein FliO/FliZ